MYWFIVISFNLTVCFGLFANGLEILVYSPSPTVVSGDVKLTVQFTNNSDEVIKIPCYFNAESQSFLLKSYTANFNTYSMNEDALILVSRTAYSAHSDISVYDLKPDEKISSSLILKGLNFDKNERYVNLSVSLFIASMSFSNTCNFWVR